MGSYRGVVRVGETDVVLDAGGVKVRLEGDREKFTPLNGLFRIILGQQSGDVIRNAMPETATTISNGGILFELIIAAIKENREALRAIPGVFDVGPGFRTSEGEMTERSKKS